MKKLLKISAVILLALTVCNFDGCDDEPSADKSMGDKQEAMAQQANQQVGMPGITNFTEKKLVRKLYELRDQNIATFSYAQDMQGRLWHICDSIGYGLPYGVQFTNPERHHNGGSASYQYNLPQPEPNGLFMPPTAEGTWIICAAQGGEIAPVYVEPHVIISSFKLRHEGEYQQ